MNKAQHVLITGASGFIGGALARWCVEQDMTVTGIGNGLADPDRIRGLGLSCCIAGRLNASTLAKVPEPPDLVFHCAGGASVQASVEDPARDLQRTVESTEHLARWLVDHAPQSRLVYPSSGAVYGDAPRDLAQPANFFRPISPYGRHKLAAEQALQRAAQDGGLRVSIVRLFSVYGPGLRKQLLWDACHKMQAGQAEFFGTGAEKRDFLEISDTVALLWLASAQASAQAPVFDGGTGTAVEIRTVLGLLATNFQPPPDLRFLGSEHPGNPVQMVAQAAPARALGWAPLVSLESGLARYVDWFQQVTAKLHPKIDLELETMPKNR